MTPITKEQAVQLARDAGVYQCSSRHPRDYLDSELIYSLVESAYKLGRNAGLDEARQLVLHANDNCSGAPDGPEEFAAAIESLKDNK